MQPRTSVGDGFRVSTASSIYSNHSNSSGGSEPDDKDSFRDVYIWGEVLANGVSPEGVGTQSLSKIDVLIPKPIESNVVLDVCHIGSGKHHIAIVTKQGHLFTWGKELGGRLGHGIDKDFGHPHLVEFLKDTDFDFVACGEYHTCAISKSYELYTWGDGVHNVGLLGHGSKASHWIPKMVGGPLEGLQVVSIACGTWHSALATSNGKLFTFGDGAFGVLGHGDQESVSHPKEVQLSNGLKTIRVACGVWHTAAIVEIPFQSSSNTSPWKLYTWGDGDKYRLGHGNTDMYLHPLCVAPLMEYNFHQVACGQTMTVALTTSGHVFTMGGTEYGQLGNPTSIGKIPTLIQDKLLGEFVEKISCGAHHVAVLTSKGELYTWGLGANGRLGHGDIEDRKSPTLVVALKDRNIENISCGSNFTSCVCIHKWISAIDQPDCCGCRQAFGLTRKRHNCHNCGLVFCHACSSRKALKAALTPTPEKPHRVCDNCYIKLKVIDDNGISSKLDMRASPSLYSLNGKERSDQGAMGSARTLLFPVTKPMKYLEIKNSNPESNHHSTSFVRASQVPSSLQLKDITFPSSLSPSQNTLKPTIPRPPQTVPPPTNPESISTYARQTPLRFASPRYSGNVIQNLTKKNDLLNQEVSKLQRQVQALMQKSDMQDVEIKKINKKAMEATAFAAVESSNHRITIEFVESMVSQLKKMKKNPAEEIPESKNFITLLTQAEDFLKEKLEIETSSPSVLGSEQQNVHDIPTLSSGSSKLQKDILEENKDVVRVNPCEDKGNLLQESNKSKPEPKHQNAPDIPPLNSSSSKLQKQRLEVNVDATGVNPCQDEENCFEEPKLDSKQQNIHNIPCSSTSTSKIQEHVLEENVNTIDEYPCRNGENFIESNGPESVGEFQKIPNILTSISELSELLEDASEDNVEVARVDQSQAEENIDNGSRVARPSQNLDNGSTSLDSSIHGKQGETQVVEKFAHGVYVILMLRSDGTRIFKRVKFSKRRFSENQAEEWWNKNKGRVLKKYCSTRQTLTIGPSNVTSHVNEILEASPS